MRYRSRHHSVSHRAIVAWFGSDESKRYYARPSRRRWVLSNGTFTHRGYRHELTKRAREIRRWETEGTLFEHTVPLSEVIEKAGITQEEPPTLTFSGTDWVELLDAFGFKRTDESDNDLKTLTEHLTSKWIDQDCAEVARVLRSFLEALAKQDVAYAPLWWGLRAIKYDRSLVKMAIRLLDDMWI